MISFQSVTKQFGNGSYGLRDVSFDIDPGDFVLITGPSGSGKTTVMRLLTREYYPTDGDVFFDGQSLSSIRSGQVHLHRRRIGVVFQDYKLLPEYNVWENIALALDILHKKQHEIEEQVTDLLNLTQMADKAFLFPSQLSGGEAQRISIARALAVAPDVIFADEPTGNLDKDSSLSITKLLKKINQLGTTILFATHDTNIIDFLGDQTHIELKAGQLHTKSSKTQNKNSKKTASTSSPKKKTDSNQQRTTTQDKTLTDDSQDQEKPQENKSTKKEKSILDKEEIKSDKKTRFGSFLRMIPFISKKPTQSSGDNDDPTDNDTASPSIKVVKIDQENQESSSENQPQQSKPAKQHNTDAKESSKAQGKT